MLICGDESMHHDLNMKKNALIVKVLGLQQELGKQDPVVFIKLVKTYLLHLYGSSLWDIFDDTSTPLWTEWHKLIKTMFQLPFGTHRYLLRDLVNCDHPKSLIIKRFVKFSRKLAASDNAHIKKLHTLQCHDQRSSYGRNIRGICNWFSVNQFDQVDAATVSSIHVNPVPDGGIGDCPCYRIYLTTEIVSSTLRRCTRY